MFSYLPIPSISSIFGLFQSTPAKTSSNKKNLYSHDEERCIQHIFNVIREECPGKTSSTKTSLESRSAFVVLLFQTESWLDIKNKLLEPAKEEKQEEYEKACQLAETIKTLINTHTNLMDSITILRAFNSRKISDKSKDIVKRINELMDNISQLRNDIQDCSIQIDNEVSSILKKKTSSGKLKSICNFINDNHDELFAFKKLNLISLTGGLHAQAMTISDYRKFRSENENEKVRVFFLEEQAPTIMPTSSETFYRKSNGMRAKQLIPKTIVSSEQIYGVKTSEKVDETELFTDGIDHTPAGRVVLEALRRVKEQIVPDLDTI